MEAPGHVPSVPSPKSGTGKSKTSYDHNNTDMVIVKQVINYIAKMDSDLRCLHHMHYWI